MSSGFSRSPEKALPSSRTRRQLADSQNPDQALHGSTASGSITRSGRTSSTLGLNCSPPVSHEQPARRAHVTATWPTRPPHGLRQDERDESSPGAVIPSSRRGFSLADLVVSGPFDICPGGVLTTEISRPRYLGE